MIEVSSTFANNVFSFSGINEELHSIEENQDLSTVSVMPVNSSVENALQFGRGLANNDNSDERSSQQNGNNLSLLLSINKNVL